MIIKTKKCQLDTKTYVSLGLKQVMREFWWAWLIPFAILLIPVFYTPALWWCVGIALVLSILYVLFWAAQFVGITQMEQYKVLFDKLIYEINSQQILIKINEKQGMPISWDKIQKASMGKDHFLMTLSRAQFIYLPFSVFKNDMDLKFMEMLLKRKQLIPSSGADAKEVSDKK